MESFDEVNDQLTESMWAEPEPEQRVQLHNEEIRKWHPQQNLLILHYSVFLCGQTQTVTELCFLNDRLSVFTASWGHIIWCQQSAFVFFKLKSNFKMHLLKVLTAGKCLVVVTIHPVPSSLFHESVAFLSICWIIILISFNQVISALKAGNLKI